MTECDEIVIVMDITSKKRQMLEQEMSQVLLQ